MKHCLNHGAVQIQTTRPIARSFLLKRRPKISSYSSVEDTQFHYGINNVVLFSLGIALLELGYQNSLESMAAGTQDPIATARKLAASDHPLGLRYQQIVLQCLQCNFGMGTDLDKIELQSAVYGDVICQLEEMINSLSLD